MFSDANDSSNSLVVKGASVIFPVNKVGKQLLNKSLGQLVEGKFLDPGVKDLLKFYDNHGLNEESFLPQLVDVCGYKIIVEINNLDLAYEICRRYQSIDKMKDQLEYLWQEIEPQKLNASEQEYAQVNNKVFDYLQEINKGFRSLSYINHDAKKLKEKKNQFIHEQMTYFKNLLLHFLKTFNSVQGLTFSLNRSEAVHLLVNELIKNKHGYLNIKFTEEEVNTIIYDTGDRLIENLNPTVKNISPLKERIDREENYIFFLSRRRQQIIQSLQAAIDEELKDVKQKLDKMILDAIMASIEKYSLAKV